jgi:hypothetical protein
MDSFATLIVVAATGLLMVTIYTYEHLVDELRAQVAELRDDLAEDELLLELAMDRHPSNVRHLHLADPA